MSVVDKIADLKVDNPDEERLYAAQDKLKNDPDNHTLLVEKILSLIYLGKIEAAEKLLVAKPNVFPSEILAYIYFRKGDIDSLRALDSPSASAYLSWAQAEYKAGNLSAAKRLFESESTNKSDLLDIQTNLSAIAALSGDFRQASKLDASTPFDHHFNVACALIEAGKYESALESLAEARQEAQDEEDSSSVNVQAAYANQKLGNVEEAKQLLEGMESIPESLKLIVANNLLSLNTPVSVEDHLKGLVSYDKGIDSQGLNANQRVKLASNKLKLQAKAGLLSSKNASKHLQEYPNSWSPTVLVDVNEGKRNLRKNTSAQAIIARAQLAYEEGDKAKAAEIILNGNLPLNQPGLCALLIAANKIKGEDFMQAIEGVFSSANLDGDWTEVALLLAKSKNAEHRERAALYFESLDYALAQAGYYATSADPVGYEKSDLPSIDDLTNNVDVDKLAGGAFALSQSRRPVVENEAKPKKHKKRSGKRKLPKDFNPSRKPDPERWLPKEDRSYYKKKRKLGTSQGVATAAPSPPPPAPPVTKPEVTAKPKTKKKKKGKK